MNDFVQQKLIARPRFAAEERTGTLVLQACEVRGARIDTLRNKLMLEVHLDPEKMRGRWPVACCLLSRAAPEVFGQDMTFVSLPKDDEAIPQTLEANADRKVSTVVITDHGIVQYELRGYHGGAMLSSLVCPFSVKDGKLYGVRIIIQPVMAFLRTIKIDEYMCREMLLT